MNGNQAIPIEIYNLTGYSSKCSDECMQNYGINSPILEYNSLNVVVNSVNILNNSSNASAISANILDNSSNLSINSVKISYYSVKSQVLKSRHPFLC